MCGGTWLIFGVALPLGGLSPRVRGNQSGGNAEYAPAGSIPACAGEPDADASGRPGYGVYPRVCGGTNRPGQRHQSNQGLSPRVRGNLVPSGEGSHCARSIPACAGEPSGTASWSRRLTVYPRVCGGTRLGSERRRQELGLSPRVRGNRGNVLILRQRLGSIPACAGEPTFDGPGFEHIRVYPRVCGGTSSPGLPP